MSAGTTSPPPPKEQVPACAAAQPGAPATWRSRYVANSSSRPPRPVSRPLPLPLLDAAVCTNSGAALARDAAFGVRRRELVEASRTRRVVARARSCCRRRARCARRASMRRWPCRPASIRQHTSAYVSIRQQTSAYVSRRQQTSAYVYVSKCQ